MALGVATIRERIIEIAVVRAQQRLIVCLVLRAQDFSLAAPSQGRGCLIHVASFSFILLDGPDVIDAAVDLFPLPCMAL